MFLPSSSYSRINRIEGPERGEYHCAATNAAGRAEAVATLVVLDVPRISAMQPRAGQTLTVGAGRSLELRCTASADPAPTVQWSRVESRVAL